MIISLLLSTILASGIEVYQYPESLTPSPVYSVSVDGNPLKVIPTEQVHIAQFGTASEVSVDIVYRGEEIRTVDIRPISKGYEFELDGNRVRLKLKTFDRVSVEINDNVDNPLLIFVNPLEKEKAEKAGTNRNILYFKAGNVYPVKKLTTEGYDGVYIEGGAIVKAITLASDISNFKIEGCGIIDCRAEGGNAMKFSSCGKLDMENVLILNKSLVGCQFFNCTDVSLSNVKVINVKASKVENEKSAFDWAGCKGVTAHNLFAYGQSFSYNIRNRYFDSFFPSSDFLLEDCVGWNVLTGSTICLSATDDLVLKNVTVKGLYSIHSAHNAKPFQRAVVKIAQSGSKPAENLNFKDVFAEDPGEYLFVFTGWISGVSFDNVNSFVKAPLGSILKGTDFDHRVQDIRFRNFITGGKKMTSLKDAGFKNPTMGMNIIFD